MAVVLNMMMAVVNVIHVITMRYGHVPTSLSVLVVVAVVRGVVVRFAFVDMVVVDLVQVTVVDVVDVVVVRYGHVPASELVPMVVIGVLAMLS